VLDSQAAHDAIHTAVAPATTAAAERVAAFVLAHTERKAGPRAFQATRKMRALTGELPPALEVFASREILSVPGDAARGLFGIAKGSHRAAVIDRVPTPDELLGMQARGTRAVSLLDDGSPTAPHEDALAFALHDLCHLDKFQIDHEGQVGFFWTMQKACILHAFDLDDQWQKDAVAVVTDMNGSPIFLLAALKMRLKMAVRRLLSASDPDDTTGGRTGGPLSPREEAAFAPMLEDLLDRAELADAARDAAREITARRLGMEHAHVFLDAMVARGGAALAHARAREISQEEAK
jgi:hypothetical protein